MKEEFEKIGKIYDSILPLVKESCIEYITKTLETLPDKEFVSPNDEDDYPPAICYDGGNHPEYATDVFATPEVIKLRYDEISEKNYVTVCTNQGEMLLDYLVYIDDYLSLAHYMHETLERDNSEK